LPSPGEVASNAVDRRRADYRGPPASRRRRPANQATRAVSAEEAVETTARRSPAGRPLCSGPRGRVGSGRGGAAAGSTIWQTGALGGRFAVGGGRPLWWFLQPLTAEALYARIPARNADESFTSKSEPNRPIRDILRVSGTGFAAIPAPPCCANARRRSICFLLNGSSNKRWPKTCCPSKARLSGGDQLRPASRPETGRGKTPSGS